MTLKSRATHNFIEIKVDEIEVRLFKDEKQTEDMIENLVYVLDQLLELTGKNITDYFNVR